jgi:hypothetical protein
MLDTIVTSAILELLIFPVIYVNWRKRELPDQTEEPAPLVPPALVISSENRKRVLICPATRTLRFPSMDRTEKGNGVFHSPQNEIQRPPDLDVTKVEKLDDEQIGSSLA